jgi:hypothetical protein
MLMNATKVPDGLLEVSEKHDEDRIKSTQRSEMFANLGTESSSDKVTESSSPLSLLRAGQVGPFLSYPSTLLAKVVGELIDYCEVRFFSSR